MLIRDIQRDVLARRLRANGVHLVTGAFTVQLRIELPDLVDEFAEMYAQYPAEDPPAIADMRVRIAAPSLTRRYIVPQAQAWADGGKPFAPIPADRAYTLLESVFNWATATSDVVPLLIHSAVLERDGRGLMLPAPSGSGKSTLCAALAWRGWRLFSDEMTLFRLEDGELLPNPRPVSLKNRSIEAIAAFEPRARLSRTYRGTPKGDVAYMQAPPEAVARVRDTAVPGLVIAPVYLEGAPANLEALDKVQGFRLLTENAVNYASLLRTGFEMFAAVVERCPLYKLTYSDLDEAVDLIDRLHQRRPLPRQRE